MSFKEIAFFNKDNSLIKRDVFTKPRFESCPPGTGEEMLFNAIKERLKQAKLID